MSGSSSRRKGASAERELFGILNALYGSARFKRNLLQSRVGGADNEPVHGEVVALEVKRHETPQITRWMAQCIEQAKAVYTPVLAWRASKEPWRIAVVMTPEQFVEWLKSKEPKP